MTRYRRIRKRRGNPWTSETSKCANKARWSAEKIKCDAEMSERIREIQYWDTINLPRKQGDALGCLQWTDFATGKVRRWTVRIGDRIDRVTLESPSGKCTGSHGWTWVMDHLRSYLCSKKINLNSF